MNHTLADTHLTEGVTADGCPATHYVVHADRAIELLYSLEGLVQTTFECSHFRRCVFKQLLRQSLVSFDTTFLSLPLQ